MEITVEEAMTIHYRDMVLAHLLETSTVEQKAWLYESGYSSFLSNRELDKKIQKMFN